MSEAQETAAPQASAEAQKPAQQAPAAAVSQPSQDGEQNPQWLGARLDRERKAVLKQLGVENVEDAKAAIEELRKRRDSEKSESEKLRAELDAATKLAIRAKELEGVIAGQASAAVAALTDAQREAVLKLSGDDPSAVLRAIEALRPTWAAAAPAAPPSAPVKQAPLSTSAATPSPAPSASEAENHKATYERLLKQDPQLAGKYRLNNWSHFFGS